MTPAARRWLWRLALLGAVAAVLLESLGMVALVFCVPVAVVLLARPLADLFWRDVEGRHYAHRGRHVDVREDEAGHRWLRAADLRRIIPGLPSDERLQALYPAATRRFGGSAAYLEAEAVIAQVLVRAQEPATLKLVHWIEREVAGPAKRRREAEGLSPPASPGTAAAPASGAPRTDPPADPSRAPGPGA